MTATATEATATTGTGATTNATETTGASPTTSEASTTDVTTGAESTGTTGQTGEDSTQTSDTGSMLDPCAQGVMELVPEEGWSVLFTRFVPGSSDEVVYVASKIEDNVTQYRLYSDVLCGASERLFLADVEGKYFAWDGDRPVFVRGNQMRRLEGDGTETVLPTPACYGGNLDVGGDVYVFGFDWIQGESGEFGSVAGPSMPCQAIDAGLPLGPEGLPRLSPDGSRLLFGHEEYFNTPTCDDPAATNREFIATAPTGGVQTKIPVPKLNPPACSAGGPIAWLPDNQRALYVDTPNLYLIDTVAQTMEHVGEVPFIANLTYRYAEVASDGKRFLLAGAYGGLLFLDVPPL